MKILSELPLEGAPIHTIKAQDLCDLLGISKAALSHLKARGIAIHRGHDSYDVAATITNYVTHLRGVAAGWGTPDEAKDLTAQRTRLAKEQADAQALKNEKLRGELVDASAVERQWSDILRQLSASLLAVPAQLRSDLPDLERATIEAMDRALRDTLTELGHADD